MLSRLENPSVDLQFPTVLDLLSKGWEENHAFIAPDFGAKRDAEAGKKARYRFEEHRNPFARAFHVSFPGAVPKRARTSRHTSSAAAGLPKARAAWAISASLDEPSNFCRRNGKSSTRLALAAAPCSSRKSLLAASWPGIGLRTKSGLPMASASELVKPPGLVTIKSATAISS